MHGAYSPSEVVYLLSLSRGQALEESVRWADSCGNLSADDVPSSSSTESDPVLLIARWADVHAARRRIVRSKEAQEVLALRLAGATERDVADATGLSAPTVHRRFRASVEEILTELAAHPAADERSSSVSACLSCGTRPRVGSSVCRPCAAAGERRREERRQRRREQRHHVDEVLRDLARGRR